ncbi:MAG: copper chaperone PCu(A)C [Chloroflexi bacterium]|nr:copper chaperone PCu(A)C [Chloroflexota bacterium]
MAKRTRTARRRLLCLLLGVMLLAGCRQQQPSATDIQLSMSVSDLLVGETTLLVKVTDKDGKALANPGTLKLRGDMDHAGMVPVLAEADSAANGVFTLPFEWTMGGGWTVEARLTLPDGTVASETFRYQILTEASDSGMADMDHSRMDQATATGESSAVYMRISNQGEGDITIISASSAAAAQIEIHETIVVDDLARMEYQDSLLIPAGETIELAPGGKHLMLMGLTADLLPGSQMSLQLQCDQGEVYDLHIAVKDMLMNDLNDDVQVGDLIFSNRWARPASRE